MRLLCGVADIIADYWFCNHNYYNNIYQRHGQDLQMSNRHEWVSGHNVCYCV